MAIFVTGSTGYLGSYVVAGLLRDYRDSLNLLVRANSRQEAHERLWHSLQLHFDFPEFFDHVNSRVRIFGGDLTSQRFGLSDDDYHALVDTTDSIIHCAASLNRKSERQCLNVNLRASRRTARDCGGIRTFPPWRLPVIAGTKWWPKIRPSIGTARTTTPMRAPRNFASTWSDNFFPMCHALSFGQPSSWATVGERRPRSSTWCRLSICSRACLRFR